jgi:hypothetical protein
MGVKMQLIDVRVDLIDRSKTNYNKYLEKNKEISKISARLAGSDGFDIMLNLSVIDQENIDGSIIYDIDISQYGDEFHNVISDAITSMLDDGGQNERD